MFQLYIKVFIKTGKNHEPGIDSVHIKMITKLYT